MTIELALMLPAALMALGVVLAVVELVPHETAYVVARFGQPRGVWQAGLHVRVPWADRVIAKVPLGEQTIDVLPVAAAGRDGKPMTVEAVVRVRVVKPMLAATAVADWRAATQAATIQCLKDAVGRVDAMLAPTGVGEALGPLKAATASWGIDVLSLEPFADLSEEARAELEEAVRHEREQRVIAFARERGERVGAVPTLAQTAAYEAHVSAIRQSPEYREALRTIEDERAADAGRRVARASGIIAVRAIGLVEERGRMTPARNVSDREIPRGAECVVVGEDGDLLLVQQA